jgi:hypothetical protein
LKKKNTSFSHIHFFPAFPALAALATLGEAFDDDSEAAGFEAFLGSAALGAVVVGFSTFLAGFSSAFLVVVVDFSVDFLVGAGEDSLFFLSSLEGLASFPPFLDEEVAVADAGDSLFFLSSFAGFASFPPFLDEEEVEVAADAGDSLFFFYRLWKV